MNRLNINFYNDWLQFFCKVNWVTISVVKLEFEVESYLGNVSLDVAFLGFGTRLVYVYNPQADGLREIEERMSKFLKETKEVQK